MKTIIATFGIEPAGITESIKQNGCEKLIVLISEKLNKKASEGLKEMETIAKGMKIVMEKVNVDQYSLMENIQKIKELIERNDDVTLNVTGGRKTLSLAATLAGFVTNPKRIIYVTQEKNELIEIPKFTIGEKLLSQEKRTILKSIGNNTTLGEIESSLKKNGNGSKEYHVVMKHLRELAEMGLVEINSKRPRVYNITPSGELLR